MSHILYSPVDACSSVGFGGSFPLSVTCSKNRLSAAICTFWGALFSREHEKICKKHPQALRLGSVCPVSVLSPQERHDSI